MALMAHLCAGWEIRPHARHDRAGIQQVYASCLKEFPWPFARHTEPEGLEYVLSYTTTLVATEPSAGIVGFMILNTETGYLSHLFVDPDWRFCGIGSGLMDVGRVLCSTPLIMELDLRNAHARAACAAAGWQEMATQDHVPIGHVRLTLS